MFNFKFMLTTMAVFIVCSIAHAQNNRQQESPPKIIRKSNEELQAAAITRISPEYPVLAKAAKASGKVDVEVTIDEAGNVISAVVISGHPLLRHGVIDAAQKWKFNPALLSDPPMKVMGTITFNFEQPPPITPQDQEKLQRFLDDLERPSYSAPTTPEAIKKLQLAEEAADRFIQRFQQTLNFGVVFDELYVSNPAQRRRNIYFVLSTAPNNHQGWEKKFDEAIVREAFIAFMDEHLLRREYVLSLQHPQKGERRSVPPEIIKADKEFHQESGGNMTLAGIKQYIAKANRLSSLYRKYLSPGVFDSPNYKMNLKDALDAAATSGIVHGFPEFGVGKNVEIYYVERHVYKLYLIEEEGKLRVLTLGFVL